MNVVLIASLALVCAVLMILENSGVRTTLNLQFKGDIKRESRWFAQYGQSACSPVAVILVWQIDPRHLQAALPVAVAVVATSVSVMIVKRLIGRVRPGRENAGKFLGPSFKHANYRESFPSSHTACAVALSAMLAHFYPAGAPTFWTLAVICGLLRYVLDAHWPSDIVGGIIAGCVIASATSMYFKL
jgi:membrane-associated phospholipid phosphatase